MFFDGGVTDYYLNLELSQPAVLLGDVHPGQPILRSALDQFLLWNRHLPTRYFENCTVIRPTFEFINNLKEEKLPSVSDWFTNEFIETPSKRHAFWNQVFHLSKESWWSRLSIAGASQHHRMNEYNRNKMD
jgi:hypothetical protein